MLGVDSRARKSSPPAAKTCMTENYMSFDAAGNAKPIDDYIVPYTYIRGDNMWETLTKKARTEKQANVSRAWLINYARTRGGVAAAGAAGQNMLLEQEAHSLCQPPPLGGRTDRVRPDRVRFRRQPAERLHT